MNRLFASLFLLSLLCLCGCSTYYAASGPGVSLSKYKKIFIINNMDDNHHIETYLVNAVRRHGLVADSGPGTMMPLDTDAVLVYQDHWTWDFTEHMVACDIELKDSRSRALLAQAQFSGPTAMRSTPEQIIDRLVKDLLEACPKK
jgi:hypothetical protein